MGNGALKELEKIMNDELKAKELNVKVEMKGIDVEAEAYEHNLLFGKTPTEQEAKKIDEAFSVAIKKWKKKYSIE